MSAWLAGGSLLTAAFIVGWPLRVSRIRLGWLARGRGERRASAAMVRVAAARLDTRAAVLAGGVLGAALGFAWGGPIGGIVAAVYAALGVRAVGRWWRRRAVADGRARAVEILGGIASDLRAGKPCGPDLMSTLDYWAADHPSTTVLADRTRAAVSLAATTGAPLADLLERIEADARTIDRLRMAAGAQNAGARATAWLLAGLPVAGLALGRLIGADPLRVLLHTPVGAACALIALALQVAGLGWAARLTTVGSAR